MVPKSQASEACAAFAVGMPFDQARALALNMDVNPRLRHVSPEAFFIGYEGAFSFDRWMCDVRIDAGKVAAQEIRFLD